jgi:photosystem II stability/assembly factor-like uncharacterized protein
MKAGAAAVGFWLVAAPALAQAPTPTPRPSVEPVVTSLTIFAGTADGLWRTRDWGATWRRAESLPPGDDLRELKDVRALRLTGARVLAGGSGGLYVSDDFGQTWARWTSSFSVLDVLTSRYPQADRTTFIGTNRGLWKTEDDGKNWKPTGLSDTPVYRIEWPGPALVVATGRGVLVSSDGGASFAARGEGFPSGDVRALVLSAFFQIDPSLMAGLNGHGVERSSDGGNSWASAGLEGREINDIAWLGPTLYAATDAGLFKSEDLGKTWTLANHQLTGRVARLLFPLMPDSGAVVFAATDTGVLRSDDGGNNWRASGMDNQEVLSIATFPAPERAIPRRK